VGIKLQELIVGLGESGLLVIMPAFWLRKLQLSLDYVKLLSQFLELNVVYLQNEEVSY